MDQLLTFDKVLRNEKALEWDPFSIQLLFEIYFRAKFTCFPKMNLLMPLRLTLLKIKRFSKMPNIWQKEWRNGFSRNQGMLPWRDEASFSSIREVGGFAPEVPMTIEKIKSRSPFCVLLQTHQILVMYYYSKEYLEMTSFSNKSQKKSPF